MKVLIALLFVACPLSFAYAEADIKLGFLGPLTGNAAVLGADALPAIQIAIEEEKADGVDIELFIEDDQYVTSRSISSYKKLKSIDNVDAIIFLTYGGLFALKDEIFKSGILVIDTLDCDEEIAKLDRNIICISTGTEDMGEVIAKAIIAHNSSPTMVIYFDGDPFMGTLAKSTNNYLIKSGLPGISSMQGYSATSDFKSMLLKAKAGGYKGYVFYGYDELGNAMHQARYLGIKERFYAVNTIRSPGFIKTARGADEGAFVSTYQAPRTPQYKEFIEKFKKKTGQAPSFEVSTFPSYDTIKILGDGVRLYKKSDKDKPLKEFLLDYMYTVKNYAGMAGQITIDPDGATRSIKSSLFQVENGKLIKAE